MRPSTIPENSGGIVVPQQSNQVFQVNSGPGTPEGGKRVKRAVSAGAGLFAANSGSHEVITKGFGSVRLTSLPGGRALTPRSSDASNLSSLVAQEEKQPGLLAKMIDVFVPGGHKRTSSSGSINVSRKGSIASRRSVSITTTTDGYSQQVENNRLGGSGSRFGCLISSVDGSNDNMRLAPHPAGLGNPGSRANLSRGGGAMGSLRKRFSTSTSSERHVQSEGGSNLSVATVPQMVEIHQQQQPTRQRTV